MDALLETNSVLAWVAGNTLVASLFAAAVVALGLAVRHRPALLHFLWSIALLVLLMPALPMLSTPGASLRERVLGDLWRPEAQEEIARRQPSEAAELHVNRLELLLEESHSDEALVAGPAATLPSAPVRFLPSVLGSPGKWIAGLWLLGAGLFLARSLFRIHRFDRHVRGATAAPASLLREVREVAERIGLPPDRIPVVRLLPGVGSPSIWCLGRSKLLWPAEVSLADRGLQRSTLIAHELAHLARRDHWMAWLEIPAATLLWWNPLFWLIRGRIRHFAELSCDAWAVRAYPTNRRAFAEALINMQARSISAPIALQGLGATDSECKDFEKRLNMIMKKGVTPRVSRGTATLAVLLAALASPGFSADGGDKQKQKKQEAAKVALEAPDSKVPAVLARVKSTKWMEKAEKLYAAKEHGQALSAYQTALELDPSNGRAHSRAGLIHLTNGDYDAATKHLQRQYELGELPATALYNIACAQALAGRPEKALKYVASAVRHGFANTELMAGDPDLASIRSDPEYEGLIELAKSAKVLKKELAAMEYDGNQELFLAAHGELAALLSSDAELQAEHGHMALGAGDFEGAAIAFARQAKLEYQSGTALYNHACALSRMGDVEGAIGSLTKAVKHGMSYADVVRDSDLDNLRKDPRYAKLEAAIVEPTLVQKKLKSLLSDGNAAYAMPVLEKRVQDPEGSPKSRVWAAHALAGMHMEEGEHEAALDTLEFAASLGAGVDRSAFLMAQSLAALGRDEEATRHLDYALRLGFSDSKALGDFLSTSDLCSPAKAEEMVKRAAKAGAAAKSYGKGEKKKAWAAGLKKEKKGYGTKQKVAKQTL